MPAIYQYEPARNIVVGQLSGLITGEEVLNAVAHVIEATHGLALRKDVLVLVDEHAHLQNIDMDMMERLKDLVIEAMKRHPGGRDVKTAIVTHTAVGISVFKMWDALSELHPMGARSRTFTSEAEALAWLQE